MFSRSVNEEHNSIWYNRYLRHNGAWMEEIQLINEVVGNSDFYVLKDSKGFVWIFWQSTKAGNHDIWYRTLIPSF